MKLIDNWRDAYKMLSVQAAALVTLLLTLQEVAKLIEGVSAFERFVTHPYYSVTMTLIAAAIPLLRLIKQPSVSGT